jgi:hypothetical protein
LHEPMNVFEFVGRSGNEIAELIEKFCTEARKSLHEEGFAVSKHVGGKVRDNSAAVDRAGKRVRQTEHGRIEIDKPLSQDFTLAIKHPAAFTALIEALSKHFECYAIVRNPLATIASWNSLDWFPLKDGHLPVGEKLDVDLARDLAGIADVFDRQIHILEWFYDQFRRFLKESAVIKYEALIESRGRELGRFFPAGTQLDENLASKNVSEFYDRALMTEIGGRLLKREGALWNFYSKRDVESLLAEITSSATNR